MNNQSFTFFSYWQYFKCNFCNAGDAYYNKVNQFSNEYVEEEFSYIAEKANKFDVRHVTICDNNFGMIPRDAKTAELIYKLKQIMAG